MLIDSLIILATLKAGKAVLEAVAEVANQKFEKLNKNHPRRREESDKPWTDETRGPASGSSHLFY